MNQLILKDVCKKYPNQPNYALDHINLTVGKGEFVAVMGRSGSGKTTLLNVTSIIDKLIVGVFIVQIEKLVHFLITRQLILEKMILVLFFKIICF